MDGSGGHLWPGIPGRVIAKNNVHPFPNELLRAKEFKGRLHHHQITKQDKQNKQNKLDKLDKVDKVGILSLICSIAWVSTQLGDLTSWT